MYCKLSIGNGVWSRGYSDLNIRNYNISISIGNWVLRIENDSILVQIGYCDYYECTLRAFVDMSFQQFGTVDQTLNTGLELDLEK